MRTLERYVDSAYRFFSKDRGFLLAALAVTLFLFAQRIPDPDLFARLAVGKLIATLGYVPDQDPFAFTPKKPIWVDHEWLSGVSFLGIWSVGGDAALLIFKLSTVVVTLFLLIVAAHTRDGQEGNELPFLALLTMLMSAYLWTTTVRSQIFTYLFLPYLLLAFAQYERTRSIKLLCTLPLVMLFWCNAHGGFVVGLAFLGGWCFCGLFEGGAAARVKLFTFGTSLAACAISPYGTRTYWSYILEAVTMKRPAIDEWQRLELLSPHGIFFVVLTLSILYGVASTRKITLSSAALLALSWIAALNAYRLQAIFYFTAFVYGREYIAHTVTQLKKLLGNSALPLQRSAMFVTLSALLFGLVHDLRIAHQYGAFELNYEYYPVGATSFLSQQQAGNKVLVGFNQGSYLLWHLYPKMQISLDGRYEELYPDTTIAEVVRALTPSASGHAAALQSINPDYILIESALAKQYAPEWRVSYHDKTFSVLSR